MKTIQIRSLSLRGWVADWMHLEVLATLLAMLALALPSTFNAHAQGVIWSINYIDYVGNEPGAGPVLGRQIAFDHISDRNSPILPSLNSMSGIFSMTIFTNDAGHTFFANALNEPGFTGFVAGLTDGANDYMRLQELGPTTWSIGHEAQVLGRSLAAPDLAGYNITQVGLRLNSYYDWLAPDDSWQNTLNYSLDFYGSPVPEPSTWALLGLGGALLWPALRRRGK